MVYIHITGHIGSMNHVVNRYFPRYDIQLESAVKGVLEPFSTQNPYVATLQKAERFLDLLGEAPPLRVEMDTAEAVNCVEDAQRLYDARHEAMRTAEETLAATEEYLSRVAPFASVLAAAAKLQATANAFLHYKAGRMTVQQFRQYEAFLRGDEKIIFLPAQKDADFVWGIYFTPVVHAQVVDALFAGLDFVEVSLAGSGTRADCGRLEAEIRAHAAQVLTGVDEHRLRAACEKVRVLYEKFDVKKYAALSKGRRVFTFAGWMGADDADMLSAEMDDDPALIFTRGAGSGTAPTRLRNWPIIRQFEFFTRLYGLPTYGETDPTFVLAITYTLLFGLMFGDVGHGLVLTLFGCILLWKLERPLGGILAVAGLSAVAFGFLYGSVFGVETVLEAWWRRPAQDIMGTLTFAVGLGVGLIVLSMLLHMYNALRDGRVGDFLFGANGAAGLVFYGTMTLGLVRVLALGRGFAWWLAAIPLFLVVCKHPLEAWMAGKKDLLAGGVGAFAFRTIMELFETLLAYATNTISFVRVGAFAVSHAGMMHVVLQLSQNAGAAGRIIIFILGNALVIGIEGLLVGIQALRLDFYEIFSRFYVGGGRDFTSHKLKGV